MAHVISNPRYGAKLLSKAEVATDTYEFTFKVDGDFTFAAGQYVWIILPTMHYDDPAGDRRAMSIASSPNDRSEITLLMRVGKSGFKRSLKELKKGDEVIIEGPFGATFRLPEKATTPLVLVGAGVGMAPFLCLARTAIEKKLTTPIAVVSVDESAKRLPYHDEIASFCEHNSHIESHTCYKKLAWSDIKDIPYLQEALIYITGSQGFVDYAYQLLMTNGIFEHQMRFESYYPVGELDKKIQSFFDSKGHNKITKDEPDFVQGRRNILQLAIESTTHHVVITDTNGILMFANEAAQKITGYSFAEMQGNTPRLWGGLMSPEFYRDLWASKLSGHTIDTELTNRRKNGETYDVLAHIAPIKDQSGEVFGFIGSEEDITHIRQTEREAKEQEERFRSLTEKIPEVYWITALQPEEKVLYVSPAFRSVWGIPEEALYKNPGVWADHIHADDKAMVAAAFKTLAENKGVYNIEYRILDGDGEERWIHDIGEVVLDESGQPIRLVGVARDITIEKQVDKEKTEFVSLASHQLKTPISSISWNAEALLDGDYGTIPKKQKDVIEEMYKVNLRMRDLVNGLLNISRIDLGTFIIEPEPTDFAALCEEILVEMKPRLAAKGHKVIKDFDKDLGKIPADTKLLRIVFQNYISNAIKYTSDKGHVKIGIKNVDGQIVVSVANNGEPIPQNAQKKIFSKMFRASNAQRQDPDGNGLGLYLVKEIAENGGGKVWFESGKGKDTVFYISFPESGMVKKSGTKELS